MIHDIQKYLKAPKGQTNSFGGYKYRSCEDIVEAVKPLLFERELTLNLSDEMVNLGDRYYVKATASLIDKDGKVIASASGYAREAAVKKGMDDSQVTGACSSYARKYALNGLFAIDDTKDADTNEFPRSKIPDELSAALNSKDVGRVKAFWSSLDDKTKQDIWSSLSNDDKAFMKSEEFKKA